MRKITPIDRVLVLLAVLLASYQVVVGIEGLGSFAITCYTIGFGMLLVAGLLIIILGFEILESPHVAVISTIIPLSLSTGLVAEFFPNLKNVVPAIALAALLVVMLTRYGFAGKAALAALAATHTVSGLIIFILPFVVSIRGQIAWQFIMVGFGGALIGGFGLLLSFLKAERSIVTEERLWGWFPVVLVLATGAFVWGFAAL